jgi:hypothetical protein
MLLLDLPPAGAAELDVMKILARRADVQTIVIRF